MELIKFWCVLPIYVIITWCQVVQVCGNCRDADAIFKNYSSSTDISEISTDLFFPNIFVGEDTWELTIKKYNNIQPDVRKANIISAYFVFNATINSTLYLGLTKPLDKEVLEPVLGTDTDSILLGLTCTGEITVEYEYTIRIRAVNEFPATFQHGPFSINIPEDTVAGTSVFNLNSHVKDMDIPEDRPFTFSIVTYNSPQVDGQAFFRIPTPVLGVIELSQNIDFDEIYKTSFTYRILNVTVRDTGNTVEKAFLRINITDVDDQPPAFNYPGCVATSSCDSAIYKSYTYSSYRGVLGTVPQEINARDKDTLNYSLRFSFLSVSDNPFSFTIDQDTGKVSQVGDIFQTVAIQIKAEEISTNSHFATASLIVYAGNETVVVPITPTPAVGNAGASKEADNTDDFKIILVIVAVIAVVVITVLIVAFLVYHRKQKKAVSPGDNAPSETSTETEEIQSTKSMQWPPIKTDSKVDLLEASATVAALPTPDGKRNRLPPLEVKDSSTETETFTKKKRSRRRNKNKEPEIFDGTREYEMEADPEFFDSTDKSKIKRSSRSKDTKTDPKYWITLQNDF